uniref:Amino acid transporter transmembrane domain-containing protein n=1 Tax=Acrobeloides nanus TaxID=290746 RepID=A0A914EAX9_9BILA
MLILKSPEEFWWAGIIAMCTTSCAVILICIGSIRDYHTCSQGREFPQFKVSNYFVALGTILFAYGGHPVFPTIQHDMKKPHHFTRSAIQAYTILTFMYLPASILGSLTYGDSLRDSVINSLQTQWIQSAVNIFITLHVIFTLIIMFNPMNQEVEEMLGVPQEFGIWRIVSRGGVLAAAVLIAETVPKFGPMLNLVGASTMTLTSAFFPAVFYLYLTAREVKAEQKSGYPDKNLIDETPSYRDIIKYNSKLTLVLCATVIVVGLVGGSGATYSAISELINTNPELPCYIRPFFPDKAGKHDGAAAIASHTNCCGMWQNISRSTDIKCNEPFDFYNQGLFKNA